ncbi:hypothetical protein GF369_00135 [Candidatus Peregrinibacteria bacterium]|nr:hypothetical protein [Candidatus Peregrinibacteria bacterium]
MEHRKSPVEDFEAVSYYRATHVMNVKGDLYEIYPLSEKVGLFIIVHEDSGEHRTVNRRDLERKGYVPVTLEKTVAYDPDTNIPMDVVEQLNSMRAGAYSVLDCQDDE